MVPIEAVRIPGSGLLEHFLRLALRREILAVEVLGEPDPRHGQEGRNNQHQPHDTSPLYPGEILSRRVSIS